MSEYWQLAVLVIWLASLLLAAYLGYDRGRWQAGLILGLLFGPLGVLGAGMLTPSFQWEVNRKYRIGKHLRRLQRRDAQQIDAQRKEAREFDRLAEALGDQIHRENVLLSEQLGHLAQELEQILENKSARKPELQTWVNWLHQQRERVRLHEVTPPKQAHGLE